MDQLLRAIDYHRYELVIVDTLARALGYVDPNKAADMNLHLGTLQRAAVDRNMTILLIDHHRKNGGEGSDVIDDLLGATAKAGVLDVAWGLYRKRGEKTATLKLTGRDIEERELAMRFDRQTGCWECLGDAAEIIASEQEQAVLDALKKLGGADQPRAGRGDRPGSEQLFSPGSRTHHQRQSQTVGRLSSTLYGLRM